MSEEFIPKEELGSSVLREVYDWAEAAMIAVVCVVMMFTFVMRMAGVDGDSMNPTLQNQDRLLISRMFYEPAYGDIVVVTKPNFRDEPLIKRVIATEGQEIDIDFEAGIVFINQVPLVEDYIANNTHLFYDMEFPQVVPEGHVFVMGDNRNASWDSRAKEVGMIDVRYILGKVFYRVLPYDQMGFPR